MHGFTLSLLLPLLYSFFSPCSSLQTNSPRRTSQRPPSDSHRKWPHKSVHHDPMAATPWESSKWSTPGLHHQVKRPWQPACFSLSLFFLSRDRCLSGPVPFRCDNNCYASPFSPFPFCFILAHCVCRIIGANEIPSSTSICCHLSFCSHFITALHDFFFSYSYCSQSLAIGKKMPVKS